MENEIDHPSHYGGDTPYEVVKVLEAWGLYGNGLRCQTVQYLARADRKGQKLRDLKAARWWLDREIRRVEQGLAPGDPEVTGPEPEEADAPAPQPDLVITGRNEHGETIRERFTPCMKCGGSGNDPIQGHPDFHFDCEYCGGTGYEPAPAPTADQTESATHGHDWFLKALAVQGAPVTRSGYDENGVSHVQFLITKRDPEPSPVLTWAELAPILAEEVNRATGEGAKALMDFRHSLRARLKILGRWF